MFLGLESKWCDTGCILPAKLSSSKMVTTSALPVGNSPLPCTALTCSEHHPGERCAIDTTHDCAREHADSQTVVLSYVVICG